MSGVKQKLLLGLGLSSFCILVCGLVVPLEFDPFLLVLIVPVLWAANVAAAVFLWRESAVNKASPLSWLLKVTSTLNGILSLFLFIVFVSSC